MQNAKVRSLTLCALFAALLAVCSQIQIPLPMVPINLALFAAHLAGAVLGAKYGALSVTVYAALGLVGVPVFAGFGAGPATLFGRTGGYVLGYILAAAIAGLWRERHGFAPLRLALGLAGLLCAGNGMVHGRGASGACGCADVLRAPLSAGRRSQDRAGLYALGPAIRSLQPLTQKDRLARRSFDMF